VDGLTRLLPWMVGVSPCAHASIELCTGEGEAKSVMFDCLVLKCIQIHVLALCPPTCVNIDRRRLCRVVYRGVQRITGSVT